MGSLKGNSLLASLSRQELVAVADWLVHAQEDDPLLILKWDAAREAAVTTGGPLLFHPHNSLAVCSVIMQHVGVRSFSNVAAG